MTNLFQVRTLWTGRSGLPGTNTFYGSEGDVAVADMRTELGVFYAEWCADHCDDAISVTIPSSGDVIDSNTGGLIGVWTDGTDIVHTGANTDPPLPYATQVLVQLLTTAVESGRKLRGRFFLPGACTADSVNGAPAAPLLSSVSSAANTCFNGDFAVYSPTHHTWATVARSSVWTEFAVLRSRRD